MFERIGCHQHARLLDEGLRELGSDVDSSLHEICDLVEQSWETAVEYFELVLERWIALPDVWEEISQWIRESESTAGNA